MRFASFLLLLFPLSCLSQNTDSHLQPPKFSDFRVSQRFLGKNATPKITDKWRLFRTRISSASKRLPNFAGHYRVVQWGCGSDCLKFVLLDLRSGSVYDAPFESLWLDAYQTHGWRGAGLEYHANSRLLLADGCASDACSTSYYEWTGTAFRVIPAPAEHEQMFFGEEAPLQHPVPVKPAVLKVLLQTTAAKQGLEFAKVKNEDPATMFRAAEVHLRNSEQTDLVVLGQDWMTGADNDWFWLVSSADKNPKVVLFVGGNSVELGHGLTNGYRNITSHFYTASGEVNQSLYRFDGTRYVRTKNEWTPTSQMYCH